MKQYFIAAIVILFATSIVGAEKKNHPILYTDSSSDSDNSFDSNNFYDCRNILKKYKLLEKSIPEAKMFYLDTLPTNTEITSNDFLNNLKNTYNITISNKKLYKIASRKSVNPLNNETIIFDPSFRLALSFKNPAVL